MGIHTAESIAAATDVERAAFVLRECIFWYGSVFGDKVLETMFFEGGRTSAFCHGVACALAASFAEIGTKTILAVRAATALFARRRCRAATIRLEEPRKLDRVVGLPRL